MTPSPLAPEPPMTDTATDPCPCLSWARDAQDEITPHHPRCDSPLNAALWECPNCRVRAINGTGPGWHSRPDACTHACGDLADQQVRMRAHRVRLDAMGYALLAMVRGFRAWAADEDGVHYEAWPAYVEACRVLGLPKPSEDSAS